jgi:hypothetical protein
MLVDRIYRAILEPIDTEQGASRRRLHRRLPSRADGKSMNVHDVHKRTDRRMYRANAAPAGPASPADARARSGRPLESPP